MDSANSSPMLPALPIFPALSSPSSLQSTTLDADDTFPDAVWGSPGATSSPDFSPPPKPSESSDPWSHAPKTTAAGYAADAFADLDPFAPASAPWSDQESLGAGPTLGSMVLPTSRLELMEDSDSSPTTSPTIPSRPLPPPPPVEQDSPPTPPKQLKPVPSEGSTAGGFLGGMFRTASGSGGGPTAAGNSTSPDKRVGAEDEKESLRTTFSEKEKLPSPGTPTASSSRPGPSSVAPTSASLSNPLASLASVFRSATSSRTPSQAGTPQASSPAQGEKGAYMESGRKEKGRKGKEAEKQSEALVEAVFDFNKFLEQMRTRSADPIAKYLRSFLKEFSRRPPVSSTDQIRVINDFLDFIAGKMRAVDPWKELFVEFDLERAEMEFDMAMEAMEKLVMNRLWHLTYTPALDLSSLPGHMSPTDDLERDYVLTQRIRLFSWIQPCHLDLPLSPEIDITTATALHPDPASIPAPASPLLDMNSPPVSPKTEKTEKASVLDTKGKAKQKQAQGFLDFAQKELFKINQYKAPRDKLICILNCCKVIFGLIRHVSADEGADAFIPFLIYVVLKANPEHLVSNIQYIQRFRNPEKLSGEGGYYLSSLNGAISFIETMDASSLSNITQSEFETEVEKAIQSLPVDPNDSTLRGAPISPLLKSTHSRNANEALHSTTSELTDTDSPTAITPLSYPDVARAFMVKGTESVEAVVSNPLGAIGKIFESFDRLQLATTDVNHEFYPAGLTPTSPPIGRAASIRSRRHYAPYTGGQQRPPIAANPLPSPSTNPHAAMYAADGMNPEEVTIEIDRQHELKRLASIETLQSIFPALEMEVLEMVLLSNSGDMAKTIDALLEMS